MHLLRNFKNFATAELDLSAPVTVLIGKNASGKTNVIEAVELLAHLAHGHPLHEITDVGRGAASGALEIGGGLVACARSGHNEFELGFSTSHRFSGSTSKLRYRIKVEAHPAPRISSELLSIGNRTIFHGKLQSADRGALLGVRYCFAPEDGPAAVQLSTDQSVLSRYVNAVVRNDPALSEHSADALSLVDATSEYLRLPLVFDPDPRAMRSYERIGQRVLLRDGANLSAVLYDLQSRDDDTRKTLARLLATVRQFPEEPFDKFGFAVTTQDDVLFGIHGSGDPRLLDARALSDGTLRSLAVLTALETVPEGSRVIIEELDHRIHPTRVGMLTGALWECSERRKLNVLVTTHNPATLDALTSEQLRAVVLCVLDPQERAAKPLSLEQVPGSDLLFNEGHLGDLITRRVLDQHLVPEFEERRQALAEQWVKSLQ